MNQTKPKKATDFKAYLDEQLKDKKFKKNFEKFGTQLEIAFQIAKTRKQLNISQAELAKKIGTAQSNVARMESGQENFTISFLSKIAVALNKELKISLK